jgi:hypothetical protein
MKQFLSFFDESSVTPADPRMTLGLICEAFGLVAMFVAGFYLLSAALS